MVSSGSGRSRRARRVPALAFPEGSARKSLAIALAALSLWGCSRTEPAPEAHSSGARRHAEAEPAGTFTPAASPLELDDPSDLGLAPFRAGRSPGPRLELRGPERPERTPDVIYIPTPQPVVERMLELARVTEKDLVYDLGCGDGRIVVTAAKQHGARGVGFDIDPRRVAEARENARRHGVEHLVTIEQQDIFTVDVSPASVVTLYLLPQLNAKLVPQLEMLEPGSRIVSHQFDMEGIEPDEEIEVQVPRKQRHHRLMLWKTPIRRR